MRAAIGQRRLLVLLILVVVLGLGLLFLRYTFLPVLPGNPGAGRIALVADSLAEDYPNPGLIDHIARVLREAGYRVEVYYNESVSMELYSRLTGYDVVILRIHGGKAVYRGPDGGLHRINGLFTGLPWREEYEPYRASWVATRAFPYGSNRAYLAVLPRFFEERLVGRFRPGSVVVVASCYSLYTRDIADALAEKGLSGFIGWRGPVTVEYMDRALRLLVDKVFLENKTWEEAVGEVNRLLGPDPYYHQYLVMVRYRRGG